MPVSTLPPEFAAEVEEACDVCALPLVQRVSALLDLPVDDLGEGTPLPRGWHFLFFTALNPTSGLAPDGFPPISDALVSAGKFKVMLGGRRMWFDGDIPIGARLRRVRRITSVSPKTGKTGPLLIVRRSHEIAVEGRETPAVREEEDMIYRQAGAAEAQPETAQRAEPRRADASRPFTPTEIQLFRYSAVTYNAHRIHYDLRYATEVEGYPSLVVNGGLTGLLLLQFFGQQAGVEAQYISARNVRPLFCGDSATLNASRSAGGWRLWAADSAGLPVVELEVR